MADTVKLGGKSAEEIAWDLFLFVRTHDATEKAKAINKASILKLYGECVSTVREGQYRAQS